MGKVFNIHNFVSCKKEQGITNKELNYYGTSI